MSRQPSKVVLVIADGGRRKGGSCYGSFTVGFSHGLLASQLSDGPDMLHSFMLRRVELATASKSTDAEAEILRLAAEWAVCGVLAMEEDPKHWFIRLESDSRTLIDKLNGATATDLCPDTFVRERVHAIWKLVRDFGKVEYRHVKRYIPKGLFGH